jgi:GT2 family glycosyltransferase
MDKRIDILIPVKNSSNYLERFFKSMENVKVQYRIYLYDNNSNEDLSIFEKYRMTKIIKGKKNIGFAPALNELIKLSDAPFICITNADIYFNEDVFTQLIEKMIEKNCSAISPLVLSEDGKILRTTGKTFPNIFTILLEFFRVPDRLKFIPSYISPSFSHRKEHFVSHIENSFVIYKRELFERYGLFDHNFVLYFEDIEFQRRFYKKERLFFYPYAKVYHTEKSSYKVMGREFYVKANRIRNRSVLIYFKNNRKRIEFILLHNFLKLFYNNDFLKMDICLE